MGAASSSARATRGSTRSGRSRRSTLTGLRCSSRPRSCSTSPRRRTTCCQSPAKTARSPRNGHSRPSTPSSPPIVELFAADAFFADQAWVKERRPALVERVKLRLATLEAEFAKRPFILGSDFSAPDILMATALRLVQPADLLAAVPNLAAYLARCEAAPPGGECSRSTASASRRELPNPGRAN
jgi:hypothetical protein